MEGTKGDDNEHATAGTSHDGGAFRHGSKLAGK
jgi:hypothetical protein